MNRPSALSSALVTALALAALGACSQTPPPAVSNPAPAAAPVAPTPSVAAATAAMTAEAPVAAPATTVPAAPTLAYADVVRVKAVTRQEPIFGTVTGHREITEQTTVPKEVCADVEVQERQPEKDGNAGGTVAGAVIGGVIGSQVGKGDGKKAATVAGAVIGGVVGNKIDKAHEGGKIVTRTEQQCHTEQVSQSKVVGYDVSYRKAGGSTGSQRMDTAPDIGSHLTLGQASRTVGYDVTYRYEGKESTVRMDRKPGDRLPVVDGQVVTQTQSVD